jgi:hypothetical protein
MPDDMAAAAVVVVPQTSVGTVGMALSRCCGGRCLMVCCGVVERGSGLWSGRGGGAGDSVMCSQIAKRTVISAR